MAVTVYWKTEVGLLPARVNLEGGCSAGGVVRSSSGSS